MISNIGTKAKEGMKMPQLQELNKEKQCVKIIEFHKFCLTGIAVTGVTELICM